ncbi:MAG: hypothetical protein AB1710_11540 [Pseudomonadota bacterium]|jgi:hypothetical protein
MNINAIQQSYDMVQSPATAKKSDSGNNLPGVTNNSGVADTANLSTRGKSLSELPPLMLPTRDNVQKLSSALSNDLKELFSQAGINPAPSVKFAVDPYTGQVSVKENRPDAQQITDLTKKNPDIEAQIRNVAAISSHVVAMDKAMEAAKAYRAAQNAAEINNAVARYSSVYGGQIKVTDFSLIFNGADVQVNADGQAWMSSRA